MKIALLDEIANYTPRGRNKHLKKYAKSRDSSLFSSTTNPFSWKLLFVSILVFLVFFLFLGKAIRVQFTDKEKYVALAERNRIREFSIFSSRGLIYDRNGNIVVRNKPRFSLELNSLICNNPELETNCGDTLEEIKKYISLEDLARIETELKEGRRNVILATGVDKESILKLEANLRDIPGLSIETAPTRDYLYNEAFSHVLGYVGLGETLTPTIVGKTGIEQYYNQYLSGVPGYKVVQVDSAGTKYSLITYKDPLPGKNIELFIDAGLQKKAYEILQEKVENSDTATGGAIVAQNPYDGSILALVSYPAYNPNLLSGGISTEELAKLNSNPDFPFFNRAIGAVYPPGSVFKLVTASAILMEKIVDKYATIFDSGYIQVGAFIFRNWNLGGHGEVNLSRALQVSNDTYFYTMGGGYGGVGGLGIERLHKWAKLFGYGAKTGIDLLGEVTGYMPDGTAREWYLGDDYISSIGQGDILSTPIQVNNMMTYFANGGYLFKPRIVKRIDGKGDTEVEVIAQNLIDSDSYDAVRYGVHLAATPGGTAYPLYDIPQRFGVEVAGKTGTSEFIAPDGTEKTHAWFSMFAPYHENYKDQIRVNPIDDKPIAITVFVEGGGGGSDDAAPLARELFEYWYIE